MTRILLLMLTLTFAISSAAEQAKAALPPEVNKLLSASIQKLENAPVSKFKAKVSACVLDRVYQQTEIALSVSIECNLLVTPVAKINGYAHFALKNGQWRRAWSRAMNIHHNPLARPMWKEYQAALANPLSMNELGPMKKSADKFGLSLREFDALVLKGLGRRFMSDNEAIEYYHQNKAKFTKLQTALETTLALRHDVVRRGGDSDLQRQIFSLGFRDCYGQGNGPSEVFNAMGRYTCTYSYAPGDNYAGYLWTDDVNILPKIKGNRIYFLLPIADGWYLYKET